MQYFLAEVYPLIKQRSPSVSLTITGSTVGVDLDGLELEDSVHLSGYVDDIRPLVRSANVCVAPIREGGGTRLKILEAMALGTPVVATHKSAEGLDVFDGKHILLADDPREFAEHTVKLLHDPQLCQRLTAEARELVERRYDWARIGDDFVDLVEEVTERRTTGRKTR
jgi:glycosyltransferase involved in cell wall biosynthesis